MFGVPGDFSLRTFTPPTSDSTRLTYCCRVHSGCLFVGYPPRISLIVIPDRRKSQITRQLNGLEHGSSQITLRPPFCINFLYSAMNSMQPMQLMGTPASKVYLDAFQRRLSKHFSLPFRSSSHWHCIRFGVGELSAINGIAGCECVPVHIIIGPEWEHSIFRTRSCRSYRRNAPNKPNEGQTITAPHVGEWPLRSLQQGHRTLCCLIGRLIRTFHSRGGDRQGPRRLRYQGSSRP